MEFSQIPIQEIAQTFVVTCPHGIHMRVAADLAKITSKFESDVRIRFHKQEVNAKSVLRLLELGAAKGEKVEVIARGIDSQPAVSAIEAYFESSQKCDDTARS